MLAPWSAHGLRLRACGSCLERRKRNAGPWAQFYDERSGRLVGYAFYTAWRGGKGHATVTFGNYRDFGGVLMPASTTTREGDDVATFAITSVTYDDADEAALAPPEPVRRAKATSRPGLHSS